MADKIAKRGISIYIDGKEVSNSVKGIRAEMLKLSNEQSKMTIGSDEYVAHAKKIAYLKSLYAEHNEYQKKVSAEYNRMGNAADTYAKKSEGSLSRMANGLNKYLAMFTAGLAAVTGLTLGLKKFMDMRNELEESKANLGALTGLDDQSIEWLTQQSKALSSNMTKDGVRIRQSSKEIIDAMTVVGSQRPELLKNKEALLSVTKDAITMSIASKDSLEASTEALTNTLNQFNLEGKDSNRVINAMAAGSKAGAATIPYLSQAIEKSGTTFALMGVEVETAIGVIEGVAPKFKKAELAGNSLDKILLKMKDSNIGYKSGVFNMIDAIEELKLRFAKGETASKLFGVEHAKMAEVLVQALPDIAKFTKEVTGTNIAFEQAGKNSKTVTAQLAQAQNKFSEMGMELVKNLNPAMLKAANLGNVFLKLLMGLPKFLKENKVGIVTFTVAVIAYTVAVNAANVATKAKVLWDGAMRVSSLAGAAAQALFTGNIIRAKAAMVLLNRTMIINPYVAIAAILAVVTNEVYKYVKGLAQATQAQKSMQNIQKNTSELYEEESEKIRLLNLKVHSNIFSIDERRKALEELKKIIPGYNAMLSDEGKLTNDNTKAIDDYLVALEKQIRLKATQEEWEALIRKKRIQEKELEAAEKKAEHYKDLVKTSPNMAASFAAAGAKVTSIKNDIEETSQALLMLEAEIKKSTIVPPEKQTDPNGGNDDTSGGGSGEPTDEAYKKAEKALEKTSKIRQLELQEMYRLMLISEKMYNSLSEANTLLSLEEKLKLQQKFGQETIDTEMAISAAKLKMSETDKKRVEEYKKALENLKNIKIPDITEDGGDADLVAYKKKYDKFLDLKEKYGLDELKNFKTQKELELDILQYYLDKGLVAEKAAARVRAILASEEFKLKTEGARETAQEIANIASNLSGALQGFQAAEERNIETKYQKEIDAAQRAGRDTTKIEDRKNKELAALRAENADAMFAVQVAGIVASTAAAAIDAYANALKIPGVGLVLAPIAAGAAVSYGLSQVAQAEAARQAAKEGYYDGGFTGGTDPRQVRGYVHGKEFVATHVSTANPNLLPAFNLIDEAQKNGTAGSLTKNDLARALNIGPGNDTPTRTKTAVGGYNPNAPDNPIMAAMLARQAEVIEKLNKRLDEPFEAYSVVSGKKGSYEQTKRYEKLIKNASR